MIQTLKNMDAELLTQALNYHGQEFRRALDSEMGSEFLKDIDMREVNYFEYHRRAKEFGFQERKRRQKLYEFLGKKANIIYKPITTTVNQKTDEESDEIYAVMPPMESYMGIPGHERKTYFYETLQKGDPVIGQICGVQNHGFVISLICLDGGKRREIYDLGIKGYCAVSMISEQDKSHSYHLQDFVRGAVLNNITNPGAARLHIAMKNEYLKPQFQNKMKLGIITEDDLPIHYRKSVQFQGRSYTEVLKSNLNFNNPTNIFQLGTDMGIDCSKIDSLTKSLNNEKFLKEEYAPALRRLQSSKWAFKSVKDGVSHFKAGNHVEAYQCLNKALQIDPQNVEALVARGALFANNNNMNKAIEDFEKALEINPLHGNALKYLSETLVELGRCCQEKGDTEEACKHFRKAISINNNREASQALFLIEKSKTETISAIGMPHSSSSNVMHMQNQHKSATIDNSDTRQKLITLLQQDKEKSLCKKKLMPPSTYAEAAPFPSPYKLDVQHQKEMMPRHKYDGYSYQSMSPTIKRYEETGMIQQTEMFHYRTWKNEENSVNVGRSMYETKEKMESSLQDRYPVYMEEAKTETNIPEEKSYSLEERLKEYYKKVGEDSELSKNASEEYGDKSPLKKELPKMMYTTRNDKVPLVDQSLSDKHMKTLQKKNEGIRLIQNIKKRSLKSRSEDENLLRWFSPLSDKSDNSDLKMKSTSEHNNEQLFGELNKRKEKKDASSKESFGYAELYSKQLRLEAKIRSMKKREEQLKYDKLKYDKYYSSSSERKSDSSSSSHRHSHEHPSSKYKYYSRCKELRRSNSPEYYKSRKSSYHLHQHDEELSKSRSSRKSIPGSFNRKQKIVISRAPDPYALKVIQETAKIKKDNDPYKKSDIPKTKITNSDEKDALQAAIAAAQKINEALQEKESTTPKEDTKQKDTLQQMELFLEKLKAQKKAEANSNAKVNH